MFSPLILAFVLLHVVLASSCPDKSIKYPCPTLDKECIIKYFNAHAKVYCNREKGCCEWKSPPKKGLFVKYSEIYFPLLNSTVERHNIHSVDASNGKITAFFVDYEKGKTIITITYKNFITTIDKAEIYYYRTAKSPIYTSINSTSFLEQFDLTVYFRGINKIDIRDSITFAAVSGKKSYIKTNPSAESYYGTEFEPHFKALSENYPIFVQELKPPPYAKGISAFFLQNNICNFGVKIK